MPYLKPEAREQYVRAADELGQRLHLSDTPGHLNYVISRIIHHMHPINYASFAAIIADLEAAKLEFYRDVVGPYEEHKKAVNGPVA